MRQTLRARSADADAGAQCDSAEKARQFESVHSWIGLLLFFVQRAARGFRRCHAHEGATGRILLGDFLGAADSAREGTPRFTVCRLEADLDEELLVMIRATLTFDPIDRSSGTGG